MKRLALVFLVACGSKSSTPVEPTPAGSGSDQPSVAAECVKSGCSGTVCTTPDHAMMTTCQMKAVYACYQDAECKPQADGKCGWTLDDKLQSCLASPPPL